MKKENEGESKYFVVLVVLLVISPGLCRTLSEEFCSDTNRSQNEKLIPVLGNVLFNVKPEGTKGELSSYLLDGVSKVTVVFFPLLLELVIFTI